MRTKLQRWWLRLRLARVERVIRQEEETLHLLREDLGRLQEGPPGTGVPRVEWFRRGGLLPLTALGLAAGVAYLDYLTGYEAAFSVFYLIPILLVSWYGSWWFAVIISLGSAGLWLWADMAAGHVYSHSYTAYWNAAVRLGFFLTVTVLSLRLRRVLAQERELARTDALTGILNRRGWREEAAAELDRAARYGRPLTLVYLDLDNFKWVNDNHGHKVGDFLLRSVGQALKRNIRTSDVGGRIGGDEFAILFPETPAEAARGAVEKLRTRIHSLIQEQGWPVSCSLGVITFESAPESVDVMLSRADSLMYEAKGAGKSTVRQAQVP